MFCSVALFLAFTFSNPAPPHAEQVAENARLSETMRRYSLRDAWAGVETAYQHMLDLEVEPAFHDHVRAAHAAASVGDINALRERLQRAHAQQESREVIEWMWSLDHAYGRVSLATDGEGLKPAVRPFNPTAAKSIDLARSVLDSTGVYEGLLPIGDYSLGSHAFSVEAQTAEPLRVEAHEQGRRAARGR